MGLYAQRAGAHHLRRSGLRAFQDDVGEGEGWYFPAGIPHSIQGLGEDGCEFLLVFDDGDFDENELFCSPIGWPALPKRSLQKISTCL